MSEKGVHTLFFCDSLFFKLKDNCFTEFCGFPVKHQQESAIGTCEVTERG